MAEVVLDLTVDRITTLQELSAGGSRVERALEQYRFVPLGTREAVRLMPGIWANHRTAGRDFEAARLLGHSVKRDLYLPNVPLSSGLVKVAYEAVPQEGERAKPQHALVAAKPDEARAVIEAVVGPLRAFEVVEVIGAPNEPLVADQQVAPPAAPTPADIKAQAAARIGARVREFIEAVTAPARQVSRTTTVVDNMVEQAVSQAHAADVAASARNLLAQLVMTSRAVVEGADQHEVAVVPPDP